MSPSRSVGLDGLGQGLQVPKVVEDTGVTLPHLVCPFQVSESSLTAWVRALKFLKWWSTPVSPSRSVGLDGLGQGLQVPKVVEDTGVTLPLSSVEGLQTGTPQFESSGLPIPSRELGLTAWVKAFKFLKWWRTPASPSRIWFARSK